MAPSTVSFLAMVVVAMAVLQTSSANPLPAPPAHSPASCSETLFRLFDCLDFLQIGASIAGPPANCCTSLREVLSSPAAICLCHAIGRDLNAFAGVNIDPIRLAILPVVCLAIVPPQLPVMCYGNFLISRCW
ncbi:unnamed protein product [Miscanthus lutarioriparius]|uniref:Bifunctional inhibitor/plant lipid transfer protein/seed storage helical domain-containing protein n=1 Tax=Miscanthus lutarioriparius TaxID=422564 RepID=A0A811NEC6_9POAL|nr:unnamed protein product [Miscanthus lutarioriparius]